MKITCKFCGNISEVDESAQTMKEQVNLSADETGGIRRYFQLPCPKCGKWSSHYPPTGAKPKTSK